MTSSRDEFLDRGEPENGPKTMEMGAIWKEEYKIERPQSSLDYKTPAQYAAQCERYVPIDETPGEPPST